MDVVEQRLEHAPLLGRHRPPGIANVLEGARLYDDVIYAHLLHELLEVGHLHDHADGAGERSGIGVDPVGRHRDVVATRSRHRAERGHDGLAPLAEAHERVVELLRRRDDAPGAVDANHDGPHLRVVAITLEILDEVVDVEDDSLELDDRHPRPEVTTPGRPVSALRQHTPRDGQEEADHHQPDHERDGHDGEAMRHASGYSSSS